MPHPQRDGAADIEDDVGHRVEEANSSRIALPSPRQDTVEDVREKRSDNQRSERDPVPPRAFAEDHYRPQQRARPRHQPGNSFLCNSTFSLHRSLLFESVRRVASGGVCRSRDQDGFVTVTTRRVRGDSRAVAASSGKTTICGPLGSFATEAVYASHSTPLASARPRCHCGLRASQKISRLRGHTRCSKHGARFVEELRPVRDHGDEQTLRRGHPRQQPLIR